MLKKLSTLAVIILISAVLYFTITHPLGQTILYGAFLVVLPLVLLTRSMENNKTIFLIGVLLGVGGILLGLATKESMIMMASFLFMILFILFIKGPKRDFVVLMCAVLSLFCMIYSSFAHKDYKGLYASFGFLFCIVMIFWHSSGGKEYY